MADLADDLATIATETVLPGGRCVALEASPDLARRAADNLARYPSARIFREYSHSKVKT